MPKKSDSKREKIPDGFRMAADFFMHAPNIMKPATPEDAERLRLWIAETYYEQGKKHIRQLDVQSEAGRHPKRPECLLEAVKIFLKGRESHSVQKLWDSFKQRHNCRKNALKSGRYKVYIGYKNIKNLEEKIYILCPDGKLKRRSQSVFRDCVTEIKKS